MPSAAAAAAAPAAVNRRGRKNPNTGGRIAPGKRGVGRNHTFKFRSSIFVAQRKSNNIGAYYDLMEELNEGAYGVVYKAVHKESGAERAVKKIEKSKWNPEENQKVIDEFNVLKGLDHPNILKMYELFEEEQHFYIVTDICKGGDLLDELEAVEAGIFPEPEAAILMNQVLSSINYCHKNNFVHRDLKPENILLEQNKALHEIKLIDFGFAVPCDENHTMSEQKGTAAYMSPQAMLEEPYGQKTDVWAVGVIAYIVLAGFNPFEGHTDPETAVLVEMGEFELDIPEWDHISEDAKDFVKKCLAYEERDRLTAAQALQHPWIRNCRSTLTSTFYKSDADQCIDIMYNLQKFHAQSKLKQATCTFIASQLLDKDQKELIDKLYRSMDQNMDGKLDQKEVLQGYKSIFGDDLSQEDLDKLFDQVDMNSDGVIEYSEFVVAAMKEEALLSAENLKKAFQMFDHDKDGFISRGDLVHVMNSFSSGQKVDDVIIDKIMNQVDFKNQGKIDFEEFREAMFKQEVNEQQQQQQQQQEEDEEERLRQEALNQADNMSASSSNKKLTAKSALQMPRRRSSAQDVAAKLTASKPGQLLRNLSGSSDVSNLTADSGDSLSNNSRPPPPPGEVGAGGGNSPRRPQTKKKGITRTKSGFMTQRAEPQNHTVRKGRKPANASRSPPPPKTRPQAPAPPATKKEPKKASPPKKEKKSPNRTVSESSASSSGSSSSSSSGSSSSSSSSSSSGESSKINNLAETKKATVVAVNKSKRASDAAAALREAEKARKEAAAARKLAEEQRQREQLAKREAELRAKKEEAAKKEEKLRARREAAAKKAAEEQRQRDEIAKREAEEKAKKDAAKKASEERRKKEEAARKQVEEKAKQEAAAWKAAQEKKMREEQARKEAEERARQEAAAARKAAEERKKREELARREAEERARRDAKKADEDKQRREAEERARRVLAEAEERARKEQEARAAAAAAKASSTPTTPPEEKKLDNSNHKNNNNETTTSDADAIKALKAKKKQQKRDSGGNNNNNNKKGSLGDMLSALPSSKNYKKQKKHFNPNSSSMSVPAIPTQNSIQQRNAVVGSPGGKSPRPSIQDRMSRFGGTGGVIKMPANSDRFSPKGDGGKVGRFSAGSKLQTPDLDGSGHTNNNNNNNNNDNNYPKRASTGTTKPPLSASRANNNISPTSSSTSPTNNNKMGSQSLQEHSTRRGSGASRGMNGADTSGDLLAGSTHTAVRRNSLGGGSNHSKSNHSVNSAPAGPRAKPKMPENAPRLQDRMKLFQKNIEGNKQAGQKKALW